MHLEEFAEGNSLFHRLDPRVKSLTVFFSAFIIVFMNTLEGLSFALFVSIILVFLAKLDLKKLSKRLLAVNVFIFFLWLFLPFSADGVTLFKVGNIEATKEGFLQALLITLKANTLVLLTIVMLGTSEVFSLAHALIHLKIPKKLVLLFFFFYRYIYVMHDEYLKIRRAISLRCFQPKTDFHTYKTYAYLVGMLIIRSFERSQRIYKAMLCRGFKNDFPILYHFDLSIKDVTVGLFVVFVFLFSLIIFDNTLVF
ncbi:MAG: cobalt ECF transporter T component CbiQ [Thermodesulfovibrionales bacterium]|nr:cobalt ECF transporter T component CbiQ [Thermodesulfovibrionales bacterium]